MFITKKCGNLAPKPMLKVKENNIIFQPEMVIIEEKQPKKKVKASKVEELPNENNEE